jgi:hypothetical protein
MEPAIQENPMKKPAEEGRVDEPIFGSGAAPALAYAASWIISLFVLHWLTH